MYLLLLIASCYQIFTAQVSLLISGMNTWIEDQNSHSVIRCMTASERHGCCLSKIHGESLENYQVCVTIVPIHANELSSKEGTAESILDHLSRFSILEGIAS
ncbi:hypothetical protein CY34DRAFT_814408 [Suillus luteus UH-Slu-Lm8-n1]|uniref:Uncharacterized protein n=1 Tax=Suillus luteus UH-Slu-Lm8-n1 TaxID=930992 RepID=A0A0D0ACZ4_9AGAM|nr:hypothetical protein CY34DRAFT_814408 [Suillus luteus UH-Slu-Lm8-n1]